MLENLHFSLQLLKLLYQIGNFPFTTIEPNVGVAYVKTDCACKHFEITCQNQLCVNGTRFIPVKLIDVAGLVPGAHEGKGLRKSIS